MQKFTKMTAVAAPMEASNIDTDQIIPKQFLLAVDRKGFGKHLFHGWRYLDAAETLPNPDFVLNKPCYQEAKFIVARDNFGNGSSREHAPWALLDYGNHDRSGRKHRHGGFKTVHLHRGSLPPGMHPKRLGYDCFDTRS